MMRGGSPTGLGIAAMLGVVLVLAAASLGELWLFNWLSSAQCPSETFFDGLTAPYGLVGLIVATFLLMCFSLFAAIQTMSSVRERLFISANPAARIVPWTKSGGFPLIIMMVIACAYGGYAIVTPFCLTPQGITYRDRPWGAMKVHSWNDLSSIETACEPYRNGWSLSYRLTVNDGTKLNILGNDLADDGTFYANFAKLDRALNGHSYRFDATRVNPQCADPNVDYVKSRP